MRALFGWAGEALHRKNTRCYLYTIREDNSNHHSRLAAGSTKQCVFIRIALIPL